MPSWREQLNAQIAETERAIRAREAEVRGIVAKAEAKGKEVYERAIRTGEKVMARTPAELRALGVAAMQGKLPQAVARVVARQVVRPQGPRVTPKKPEAPVAKPRVDAAREFRAGLSGFVDEASFGAADHVLAAGNAVREAIAAGDPSGLAGDYSRSMDQKRADDAYDDKHHALARNTGRVAGFAATVAPLGAPVLGRAMLALGPKAANLSRAMSSGSRYGLDTKGLTEMAAVAGGSAGVMEQAATDALTGRRGTIADYASAGVSGAAGGVGTRWFGPIAGGALGGASSSAMDDTLAGREISVGDIIGSAHGGATVAGLGNMLGTYHAATRSPNIKGKTGEVLTRAKIVSRGDGPAHGMNRRLYLDEGGYTVTDARGRGTERPLRVFESKLGPDAKKSMRQEQAGAQFGDDYFTDGWRFSDVGKAQALVASPLGYHTQERPRERRRD